MGSRQLDGMEFNQFMARFAGTFDVDEDDQCLDGLHTYIVVAREGDANIRVKPDGDVRRVAVLNVEDARRVDDDVLMIQARNYVLNAGQGYIEFPDDAPVHREPEATVATNVDPDEAEAALNRVPASSAEAPRGDTMADLAEKAEAAAVQEMVDAGFTEPISADDLAALSMSVPGPAAEPDDDEGWQMPTPNEGTLPAGQVVGSIHRSGYKGDPVLQKAFADGSMS